MDDPRVRLFIAIMGFAASPLAAAEVASSVGVEIPWYGQLGVCGLFGGLLWWIVAKTLPAMAEANERGMKEVADRVDKVGDALGEKFDRNSESHLELLKSLIQKHGGS